MSTVFGAEALFGDTTEIKSNADQMAEITRRKTSRSRVENQQTKQPTVENLMEPRATFVGGQCSPHCAIRGTQRRRSAKYVFCWCVSAGWKKKYWEVGGKMIFVVLANCFQSASAAASPGRNNFVLRAICIQCTLRFCPSSPFRIR